MKVSNNALPWHGHIVKYPVFATFVLIIIGFYQLFFLKQPDSSTMVNQNIFAGYLIMTIPLIFYYTYITGTKLSHQFSTLLGPGRGIRKFNQLGKAFLCIIPIVCLVFTKSVAAICALLVAFFVVKYKWRGVLISILILLLGIALKLNDPDLLNRYFWWSSTINIIKNNPVFGTGLGSFPYVFLKYKQPGLGSIFAHNYYLQLVTETGVVGLLLFLTIIAWCLYNIRNQYFKIALLACLIHNIFDYSLFILANGLIFWSIMAIGIAEKSCQDFSSARVKKWVWAKYIILIAALLFYSVDVYKNNLAVRYFFQGENAYLQDDLASAERKFIKSINTKRNFHLVYGRLAYVFVKKYSLHRKNELINKAIDNFKEGIKYNPYNGDYYMEVSRLYNLLENNKLSREYLTKAVLYNPSKARYYLRGATE